LQNPTPKRKYLKNQKMVLSYNQEHVYRHPWDRVTAAAWRKYTDPAAGASLSHIADVHTLSRQLDPDSGRLVSTRSIAVRSPFLPFPVRRLIGQDSVVCHCVESSIVDASSR
jgi:PRELI-like family